VVNLPVLPHGAMLEKASNIRPIRGKRQVRSGKILSSSDKKSHKKGFLIFPISSIF
jgi:hypothetical protein